MDFIKDTTVEVRRNLDGKGRLWLPGEFREAAGFTPSEPVVIRLAQIEDRNGNHKAAFIITRQEGGKGHEADRAASL